MFGGGASRGGDCGAGQIYGQALGRAKHEKHAALIALAPKFLTWIVSFLTLGIFWVGQQTQLNHLAKAGRSLDWIHLLFLAAVSVLPFTTSLMGEFIHDRLALGLYWGNIAVLGASLYASWCHARAKNLLRPDIAPGVVRAIERRIVVAQSFYAAGAALCAIHPYWSIGFILAVQLNYAIAPRLRLWGRS